MQIIRPSRSSGWFFVFACAAVLPARAEFTGLIASSVPLERFVVSASRTPQDPLTTPSSVSVIPLEELQAEQISDLRTALAQEPGVVVVNTGAIGGPSSIFLRGANSHQTLFVVDGVRMSDRSASYSNFLGSADFVNLGRIEVLRGPQSTLFGSSAMGGVILMESVRGSGSPTGSVQATGGSFDTYGAAASVAGGQGSFGYSGSVARFSTENDLPNNDLRRWSYATRLEYNATPDLLFGATFRGQNDEYQQPGSRLYNAPGSVNSDNYLTTAYAQLRVGEDVTSRVTLGLHRRVYEYVGQWSASDLSNMRKIVDWQNTWQASRQLEIVAGANFEWSRYLINGTKSTDDVAAGYVSTTARPMENVTLTAGVRYDDFKSVGSATTWRAGAAWRVTSSTKVRATYGTGFSAPGSDDRYGVAQWGMLANPDLQPEKSRGWDAGVDQDLFGGKGTLSATYFQNRFRNLFEWEYVDYTTFQGRTVNRSRATTNGVEFAFQAKLTPDLQSRVSYTYLETDDKANGRRLARRPRHTLDAELRYRLVAGLEVGAGVRAVADRVESNGTADEDYTTARVFATYEVRRNLLLKLRVENALDERYEEVLGYASLPRGVFGGVEWRF
ncbi:TonB-dependent receptor [Opitutaceae bacterium EW11]|nr:TonB-dependent receptor [Opitutaceae bacterium EW11]